MGTQLRIIELADVGMDSTEYRTRKAVLAELPLNGSILFRCKPDRNGQAAIRGCAYSAARHHGCRYECSRVTADLVKVTKRKLRTCASEQSVAHAFGVHVERTVNADSPSGFTYVATRRSRPTPIARGATIAELRDALSWGSRVFGQGSWGTK